METVMQISNPKVHTVEEVRGSEKLMSQMRVGALIPIFNKGEKKAFGFIKTPEDVDPRGDVKAIKNKNGKIFIMDAGYYKDGGSVGEVKGIKNFLFADGSKFIVKFVYDKDGNLHPELQDTVQQDSTVSILRGDKSLAEKALDKAKESGLNFEQALSRLIKNGVFKKIYEQGGMLETREGRYVRIEPMKNGLKVSLTEEGIEEAKEKGSTEMGFWDLFEDIEVNSEWKYIYNIGEVGLGMSNAPAFIFGYNIDDLGVITDEGRDDSELYYYDNYMIKDFVEVMLEDGSVIFTKAQKNTDSDEFENGGEMDNGVMGFRKGGNVPLIAKKVAEVNRLIGLAFDTEGDPLPVVDETGTWQAWNYYNPIKYSNGTLRIEYKEGNKLIKDTIKKSDMQLDGIPVLNQIAKMYRKVLKNNGISFAKDDTEKEKINFNGWLIKNHHVMMGQRWYKSNRPIERYEQIDAVRFKDSRYDELYAQYLKETGNKFADGGEVTLFQDANEKLKVVSDENTILYHLKKYFGWKKDVTIDRFNKLGTKEHDSFIKYFKQELSNKFADGGEIKNQYVNKSAEKVWDEWTIKQREHFLLDHSELLDKDRLENALGYSRIVQADRNYSRLTDMTKRVLAAHIESGEYAKGGAVSDARVEDILKHYVAAALWSTTNMDNEEEEFLDANYSFDDVDKDTLDSMRDKIRKFISENEGAIKESGMSDEQLGHDLWLSSNGHGAGFFDRGYDDKIEKQLMDAAHNMKGTDLYVGDDGKIYAMGVYAKGGNIDESKKRFKVVLSCEAFPANMNDYTPDFETNDFKKAIAYAKKKSTESAPQKPKDFEYSDYDWVATVFDDVANVIVADFANGELNYMDEIIYPRAEKYYSDKTEHPFDEKNIASYYSESTGATDNLMDIVKDRNGNADVAKVEALLGSVHGESLSDEDESNEAAMQLANPEYKPKSTISYGAAMAMYNKWKDGLDFATAKAGQEAIKLYFGRPIRGVEIKGVHFADGGSVEEYPFDWANMNFNERAALAQESGLPNPSKVAITEIGMLTPSQISALRNSVRMREVMLDRNSEEYKNSFDRLIKTHLKSSDKFINAISLKADGGEIKSKIAALTKEVDDIEAQLESNPTSALRIQFKHKTEELNNLIRKRPRMDEFADGGDTDSNKIVIEIKGGEMDVKNYNGLLAAELTIIRGLQKGYIGIKGSDDCKDFVVAELQKRIAFEGDATEENKTKALNVLSLHILSKSVGRQGIFKDGGTLKDPQIAKEILAQLGGIGKLVAMTGAHNFVDLGNGVSFKIKNAKANYIKIVLTSMDVYDIEIGRIRGDKYTIVKKVDGAYDDMLKNIIEEATGMRLSLFEKGGQTNDRGNKYKPILKPEWKKDGFIVRANKKQGEEGVDLKKGNTLKDVVQAANEAHRSGKYFHVWIVTPNTVLSHTEQNTWKALYAEGGTVSVKWQDVTEGDSARVVAENKMGVILKAYGRKFHLKFVDGSEKTYDAAELEFFKDEEFAKGGQIKERAFENSNLWLYGADMDTNGNKVVKLGFPNRRAFSIQSNGTLPETHRLLNKKTNLSDLNDAELHTIEKEVVEYIKAYGSKEQKSVLKTYSGYKHGGSIGDTKADVWEELFKEYPDMKEEYKRYSRSVKKAYNKPSTLKRYINTGKYKFKEGGQVTFMDKVKAIANSLVGKKVPSRLKKDYGKKFDKDESIQAGKRIAGSMIAKHKVSSSEKKKLTREDDKDDQENSMKVNLDISNFDADGDGVVDDVS